MHRVIPFLTMQNADLIKTKLFSNPKYVGDPINAVKIFNEKRVDELFVCDIGCNIYGYKPNFDLIQKIANECRMPLGYAGGISSTNDVDRLIEIGVEKVGIGNAAEINPDIISDAAKNVGSQSVLAIVNLTNSGFKKKISIYQRYKSLMKNYNFIEYIQLLQRKGAGEIVINFANRDGTGIGLDIETISEIYNAIDIPITIVGGVGAFEHIQFALNKFPCIGIGVGKHFIFHGKYDAVLIKYLSTEEKELLNKET
ncbi:HisA/HisF-related TIM barrel protein [Alphaproteobacteria bacterium]|nr:HisA/HisF-related TIM barrel protein [Alphaproteobacteria bacterium]